MLFLFVAVYVLGTLALVNEYRDGLSSIFTFDCCACHERFRLYTSNKIQGEGQRGRLPNEINLKAIAASVAQGHGYCDHEYIFENIGIPTMTRKIWEKYEKMFGDRMEWVKTKHICVLLFYCCSTNTCIY